jgi:ParB-like chromosome segregation protein Spo0J
VATEAGSTLVRETATISYINSSAAIEQSPELDVAVSSLVPGFYLRHAGTNAAHVQLLADAAGSTKLPPILVQKNGSRIIDGMHRVEAAKLRMSEYICARVIDCTDEEAFILAVQTNTLHGLPLTKADRIAGAKRILSSHPDWSDRAVAKVTGLSAKTVGILRNRSTGEIPLLHKRLGRDGKRHPVSGAEGRRRAVDYIKAHPDAPLRQVAREADVSLGTVHDVRERIRRGADPVVGVRGKRPDQPERVSSATSLLGRSSSAENASAATAKRGAHNKQNAPQRSWLAISAKLANDPTLRYTEGGRAFLRWMSLHAAHAEEWREFIDAIPLHWLKDIDLIASGVSEEWRMFAEWLRTKQESAS